MLSKWRKAKLALGFKTCLYAPRTAEDSPSPADDTSGRFSEAVLLTSTPSGSSSSRIGMPTPSSSGLRHLKQSNVSSKSTCAICLATMKPGQGHAIFTAECSHSFHFHCITSNVKHGNQICPVCRSKWKEIPFQSPAADLSRGKARINHVSRQENHAWMSLLQQITPGRDTNRRVSSLFHPPDPIVFDDDELIDHQPEDTRKNLSSYDVLTGHPIGVLKVKTHAEVSAVSKSESYSDFAVLVHLKAPVTRELRHSGTNHASLPVTPQTSPVPVDLVTVLDISGSMAGTKLALLKRAMRFVIQNLGPTDRLSVIAFSSTAHRLFPLCRMTDAGRQEALQAVNSLVSNGGTNIAEGLRKGAKVMTDRKWRNPVSSIILLSDGRDTYTVSNSSEGNFRTNYQSLLPMSMHRNSGTHAHVPVHVFGFGADHDAVSMHSISESSGGTFSFIEAESVIQDAFAQCIGGLLSVVVQELRVEVECIDPKLKLKSIKAGSYKTIIESDGRAGYIEVGDLYAEEESDFLIYMDIPVYKTSTKMSLVKVKCIYKDPITKELLKLDKANDLKIQRPEKTGQLMVSMQVDRQRNRLQAAEAIAEARAAAEQGHLAAAVFVLDHCRKQLSETVSAQAGDRLYVALSAELTEMQVRMSNQHIYESSGRAYVLSGLSSHSWQRATARGDSTDTTSVVQVYQTPSMVDMVSRSQTMVFGSPTPQRSLRPAQSFPGRKQPR